MKEAIINGLKNLWINHRKKVIAFLVAALLGLIAKVSGIPVEELKQAVHEGSKPSVEVVSPAPPPPPSVELKALPVLPEKVEEKK